MSWEIIGMLENVIRAKKYMGTDPDLLIHARVRSSDDFRAIVQQSMSVESNISPAVCNMGCSNRKIWVVIFASLKNHRENLLGKSIYRRFAVMQRIILALDYVLFLVKLLKLMLEFFPLLLNSFHSMA